MSDNQSINLSYVLIKESGNYDAYEEVILAVSLEPGYFDERVAKHNESQRLKRNPTYLRVDTVPVEGSTESTAPTICPICEVVGHIDSSPAWGNRYTCRACKGVLVLYRVSCLKRLINILWGNR